MTVEVQTDLASLKAQHDAYWREQWARNKEIAERVGSTEECIVSLKETSASIAGGVRMLVIIVSVMGLIIAAANYYKR